MLSKTDVEPLRSSIFWVSHCAFFMPYMCSFLLIINVWNFLNCFLLVEISHSLNIFIHLKHTENWMWRDRLNKRKFSPSKIIIFFSWFLSLIDIEFIAFNSEKKSSSSPCYFFAVPLIQVNTCFTIYRDAISLLEKSCVPHS